MALKGSIKDFELADIFQLISLQKKSGILTIQHEDTTVTINFEEGQVAYTTSTQRGETERLGRLLLSAGKLIEKDIEEALSIQGKTGEKIGHILVSSGLISKDDLKYALETQVKDVIFQILRWKTGWYRFDIQAIEHEREYKVPVFTDFVVMEGTRMLDEWPEIESRIPSDKIIFSQSSNGDEIQSLFSSLSSDELIIYNLLDGQRDVRDIVDETQFGEFEAYKILITLMASGFISQTSTSSKGESVVSGDNRLRGGIRTAIQIAILAFILSFMLFLIPVREMAGVRYILEASDVLKKEHAEQGLSLLHRAINYYHLVNGVFPDTLGVLQSDQYIGRELMNDPWGTPFVFEVLSHEKEAGNSYRLYSRGVDGKTGTEDDVSSWFKNSRI